MSRWITYTGIVIGGLALTGVAAVAMARVGWNRTTARAVASLTNAAEHAVPATPIREVSPTSLPPPVARYFAFAIPGGQERIVNARIEWAGDFRSTPDGAWAPFTATQHFSANLPGFVWDARIRMMPAMSAWVRDEYRAGTGTMLARVAGAVTVVDEGGTPEIAQSALARWLGETAWFPTALLPGGPVRWEAIDDHTARAIVKDGVNEASAEFHFAPSGELHRMTALRYRDVNGRSELTPFEGDYGEFFLHDGMMVPGRSEVAWLLSEGRFTYWRGQPSSIRYDFN